MLARRCAPAAPSGSMKKVNTSKVFPTVHTEIDPGQFPRAMVYGLFRFRFPSCPPRFDQACFAQKPVRPARPAFTQTCGPAPLGVPERQRLFAGTRSSTFRPSAMNRVHRIPAPRFFVTCARPSGWDGTVRDIEVICPRRPRARKFGKSEN